MSVRCVHSIARYKEFLVSSIPQKRDSEIARQMKEQSERAREAEREREMERYKEMVRYQQELERQLEEQEEKRQRAYEEFLKEKLMIDEIVRKIYEEDQRLVQNNTTACTNWKSYHIL